MLTWWKKKSNTSSLNSDDPAEILLSDLVGTRLEFQVKLEPKIKRAKL
jgi:hypothetical protein